MKITIESTNKMVELLPEGGRPAVKARIWQGETDTGIKVHCYVAMIAHDENAPAEVHAKFTEEFGKNVEPRAELRAIPLRMIL